MSNPAVNTDPSRTMSDAYTVLKIDYSQVRTQAQLVEWAASEFSIPLKEGKSSSDFFPILFQTLSNRGVSYRVFEHNTEQISPEVSRVLNGVGDIEDGWKTVLGFHLFREGTGATVIFEKKRWWHRERWWSYDPCG